MEHRWYKRKSISSNIRVYRHQNLVGAGSATDENTDGLFIKLDAPLFIGEKVDIEFVAQQDKPVFTRRFSALVIHKANGGYGIMFACNDRVANG